MSSQMPPQNPAKQKWSEKIGIDGVIILLALFTFLAAVTLLLVDSSAAVRVGSELSPIGHFVSSQNDVRRRVESGLGWGGIKKTDQVYEGDNIFTGEGSTARIALNQGTSLSVEPNSLVVVRTQNSTPQFDLQYGSLFSQVTDGQSLWVVTNGLSQEITGKNAEFQVVAQGLNQVAKIQVLKGEIFVEEQPKVGDTKRSPKTQIKKDEIADIGTQGSPLVTRPEITLASPTPGSIFWLPLGAPAHFSWNRTGLAAQEPVKFELARDAEFKDVVTSKIVNANSIDLDHEQKPEGSYFWRVAPADAKQASLPTLPARISILPDEPPMPRQPLDRQELAFNSQVSEKGKMILFSWEDKTASTDFEVEVARDEGFTQVVYKKKIAKMLSDHSDALPAGDYFWRVKGFNAERKTAPWSRLSTFTVVDDAKVPAQPTLLSADLKYEIPADAFEGVTTNQLKAGDAIAVNGVTPFMWRTAENAEAYEIELSDSPDFQNATKVQVGDATTYSLPKVRPGAVFARVRGLTRKGFPGAPSAVAELTVRVPAPKLEKIPEISETFTSQSQFDEARREIALSWTPRPYAKSYELQWAADANFQRLKRYKVTGTKRTQVVNVPMNYYARVRALNEEVKPISAFSEAKTIVYKKVLQTSTTRSAKSLGLASAKIKAKQNASGRREPAGVLNASIPRPTLLEPAFDSSMITLENSKSFVKFHWKAVANTTEYQLQIAADPDFEEVVGEIWTANTRSVFQKRLPEGKVYWRVRSVTPKGYSAWSNAFDINVLYE